MTAGGNPVRDTEAAAPSGSPPETVDGLKPMAEVDFQAWDLHLDSVTAEDWASFLPWIRAAIIVLLKDRDGLEAQLRKNLPPPDEWLDQAETLGRAAERLKAFAKMLDTADIRLITVLARVANDPDYSPAGPAN